MDVLCRKCGRVGKGNIGTQVCYKCEPTPQPTKPMVKGNRDNKCEIVGYNRGKRG